MEVQQTTTETGDITTVKVIGRVDTTTSGELEKAIFETLDKGVKKVIVDMGQMDYISSSGLRVLLATLKRLKANDGHLILAGLNPHMSDVIRMAGFDQFFHITATVEEAATAIATS